MPAAEEIEPMVLGRKEFNIWSGRQESEAKGLQRLFVVQW